MIKTVKIAPSILSADFSVLGDVVKKLDESDCDYIHIDVMDGHFVPNITIGPDVISSIRKYTSKTFDVHLMVNPVKKYIQNFIDAGSDIITIHQEVSDDVTECIELIKNQKKKVGLCLNPKTSFKVLEKFIDKIDLILIMTVEPGFGGQSFMDNQITKIKKVKNLIGTRNIELEVDGGITIENAKKVKAAGANVLVSGSTIFKSKDYNKTINDLRTK